MILLLFLFDPSQLINTDTTNRQLAPAVSVYENYVHIFWEDERDPTCDFDIYCRTSTDGGQHFIDEVIVNFVHENNQRNPETVTYNGMLYVVFEDYRSYYDISFAKSTDHGKSFLPSIIVNDTTKYSQRDPSIAVDNDGDIFVVWYDGYRDKDIYLSRSTDGGDSFLPSVLVNSLHTDSLAQWQPDIGVDPDGRVFVAFTDSATNSIYLVRSTDHGQSFDHIVKVNSFSDSLRGFPDLTVDNSGYLFVVWEDRRTGDYDVYLARSTDHGTSFETEILVNDVTSRHQRKPRLAVLGSDLYCIWEDYRSNNYDVYIAKSTDHGVSFFNSVRVNDHTQKSQRYPAVAAGSQLHIAWEDYRNTSADIYATRGVVGVGEEEGKALTRPILVTPNRNLRFKGDVYDITGRRIRGVASTGIYFLKSQEAKIKIIVIR